MRFALAWLFTWFWVPITAWGWQSSSGPERGVAFLWFTATTWGASTWTLWRLGVLRRIYGPSDLPEKAARFIQETLAKLGGTPAGQQYPRCERCGDLKVLGTEDYHTRCG